MGLGLLGCLAPEQVAIAAVGAIDGANDTKSTMAKRRQRRYSTADGQPKAPHPASSCPSPAPSTIPSSIVPRVPYAVAGLTCIARTVFVVGPRGPWPATTPPSNHLRPSPNTTAATPQFGVLLHPLYFSIFAPSHCQDGAAPRAGGAHLSNGNRVRKVCWVSFCLLEHEALGKWRGPDACGRRAFLDFSLFRWLRADSNVTLAEDFPPRMIGMHPQSSHARMASHRRSSSTCQWGIL